jgi:hypothetical protein
MWTARLIVIRQNPEIQNFIGNMKQIYTCA